MCVYGDRLVTQGCPPTGLGVKEAGSKKRGGFGACPATPNNRGKRFLLGERGAAVQLRTPAASAPGHPSHASASVLHTKPLQCQDREVWRVLTSTDVRNVTQGQGFLDHQVLPISGVGLKR